MKIVDLLVKERIILDLKAKDKAEAINELAGFLKGAEEVIDISTPVIIGPGYKGVNLL